MIAALSSALFKLSFPDASKKKETCEPPPLTQHAEARQVIEEILGPQAGIASVCKTLKDHDYLDLAKATSLLHRSRNLAAHPADYELLYRYAKGFKNRCMSWPAHLPAPRWTTTSRLKMMLPCSSTTRTIKACLRLIVPLYMSTMRPEYSRLSSSFVMKFATLSIKVEWEWKLYPLPMHDEFLNLF